MIILGIDPGYAIVGYGIIKILGNKYKVLDYGTIRTDSNIEFPDRLKIIYDEMSLLIDKYQPKDLAIEELFFNKNTKSAMKVGQARGVEVLCAKNKGLDIYEYTPIQIKQAVVGYGRAEKQQVQKMVQIILNLDKIPKPDDAADALAAAICHGNSSVHKELFRMK